MSLVLDSSDPTKGGLILSALEKVDKTLDILLVNLPASLNGVEVLLRECYGYCLFNPQVVCTVYPQVPKNKQWSVVYSNFELKGFSVTPIEPISCPPLSVDPLGNNKPALPNELDVVAVGGTFDHFHYGHKLLVSVTALWCKRVIIVGITGPALLQNKKYAEYLDSFEHRRQSVLDFLASVFPHLEPRVSEINDIYGPTGTEPAIDGLLVSQETASGGSSINEFRASKGWGPLEVFEVGLIPTLDGADKVSSTQLREADSRGESKGSL